MGHLNTNDQQAIKAAIKEVLPNCKLAYIFGSYAKGLNTTSSDLDLAVLLDDKLSSLSCFNSAQKLSQMLSVEVDLIDLADTSDYLKFQIVNDGFSIIGDSVTQLDFEARAIRDYQDTKERNKAIEQQVVDNLYDKGAA